MDPKSVGLSYQQTRVTRRPALDHFAFFGSPLPFLAFFPSPRGILIVWELEVAFSLCIELVVVVAMDCEFCQLRELEHENVEKVKAVKGQRDKLRNTTKISLSILIHHDYFILHLAEEQLFLMAADWALRRGVFSRNLEDAMRLQLS